MQHGRVTQARVLGVPAPVSVALALDDMYLARHQQAGRNVVLHRDGFAIAQPQPDNALAFLHRVRPQARLAGHWAIGAVSQHADQRAAGDVEGPAVIPAGEGIAAGKLAAALVQASAAVGALVGDGVDLAIAPQQGHRRAVQGHWRRSLPDVLHAGHRIPVIGDAQLWNVLVIELVDAGAVAAHVDHGHGLLLCQPAITLPACPITPLLSGAVRRFRAACRGRNSRRRCATIRAAPYLSPTRITAFLDMGKRGVRRRDLGPRSGGA